MAGFSNTVKFLFGIISAIVGFAIWSYTEYQKMPFSVLDLQPERFNSQPIPPFTGQESLFTNAKEIRDQELQYLEDIAVDSQQNIYGGLWNGKIIKINPQGQIEEIGHLQKEGIILGVALSADQSTLYFVTQNEGLCRLVIGSNKVQSLVTNYEGKYLVSLNSLALNERDHIIYLTQVSTVIPFRYINKELLNKAPMGRVFAYNYLSGELSLIKDKLYFPNGIVYDEQTESIIFAELNRYRLSRINLSGQKKGHFEIVIDNLPGMPDNLKWDGNGQILVGLPATRDLILSFMDLSPKIRHAFMFLPEQFLVKAANTKFAGGIRIDPRSGSITEYLLGPSDSIHLVSTLLEKNGKIYMCSFANPVVIILNASTPSPNDNKSEDL